MSCVTDLTQQLLACASLTPNARYRRGLGPRKTGNGIFQPDRHLINTISAFPFRADNQFPGCSADSARIASEFHDVRKWSFYRGKISKNGRFTLPYLIFYVEDSGVLLFRIFLLGRSGKTKVCDLFCD